MDNIEYISVDTLHFDYQNPRLAEYGIGIATEEKDILKILWDAMDVQEIVQSIAASGYFQHESIIITVEKDKKIVIEGNRRLAALKVLLNPSRYEQNGWSIQEISDSARRKLKKVPCIVSNREAAWKYLGFKHVNGPAKWSSYAKAKYIAKVHRDYGISLPDVAKQIGDRHNTVQRLYRGLMVLEQAEKSGVYKQEDRWYSRLYFSHLYTGLDREGIRGFLEIASIEAETTTPVPEEKKKELGELLVWLYGSKSEETPPVIKNQNPDLKYLDQIVANREAVMALRDTNDLELSYEISRPSGAVLEESLLAAKRSLTKAQSHLTTGFENSEDLVTIAKTILRIAEDIVEQMRSKKQRGSRIQSENE